MHKLILSIMVALLCWLGPNAKAFAYTEQDVDRLTTLAAIYGRAIACGADVDASISRTGAWIDSTFGSERGVYLQLFMAGMQQNAQNQASGKTDESCDSVLKIYRGLSQ